MRGDRSRVVAVALALAVGAAVALWAGLGGSRHGSSTAPEERSPRLVLVADPGRSLPPGEAVASRDCLRRPRACVNGKGGIVLVYRVAGTPLRRPTAAVVETDERCQPDRLGVSHCLNRLRLADGRRLLVRHDHRMADSPCLSPGERVEARSLAS